MRQTTLGKPETKHAILMFRRMILRWICLMCDSRMGVIYFGGDMMKHVKHVGNHETNDVGQARDKTCHSDVPTDHFAMNILHV
ncbi:hypothetical protein JTE90_002135 [Oedothorax gibbosus]|uniref:CRIB domain-containing protein n=1 Tax=Oedothorax gibbosus TaxID=931172 RepID=A0AAV6V6H9_9ARAC|nr:hypothetical protein JTE90_002135 [Oedothorax gibbosus]